MGEGRGEKKAAEMQEERVGREERKTKQFLQISLTGFWWLGGSHLISGNCLSVWHLTIFTSVGRVFKPQSSIHSPLSRETRSFPSSMNSCTLRFSLSLNFYFSFSFLLYSRTKQHSLSLFLCSFVHFLALKSTLC